MHDAFAWPVYMRGLVASGVAVRAVDRFGAREELRMATLVSPVLAPRHGLHHNPAAARAYTAGARNRAARSLRRRAWPVVQHGLRVPHAPAEFYCPVPQQAPSDASGHNTLTAVRLPRERERQPCRPVPRPPHAPAEFYCPVPQQAPSDASGHNTLTAVRLPREPEQSANPTDRCRCRHAAAAPPAGPSFHCPVTPHAHAPQRLGP